MKTRLFLLLAFVSSPALAQPASPPQIEVQVPDDSGLSGSVSDENAWQDLGIAIPSFATDRDVPTKASAGSTDALGRALAQVITSDLKNNGLFKPTGPDALPRPSYPQVPAPEFATWSGRGAEMLVQGSVRAVEGGQLAVGCYLYDVAP